jgi:hypothetical protein
MLSAVSGSTNDATAAKKMAITPKIAAALLEKADQRKVIRQEVIQQLTDLMKAASWPTRLRLQFALDGSIVNGVHALHAIVQSGKTLEFEREFGW